MKYHIYLFSLILFVFACTPDYEEGDVEIEWIRSIPNKLQDYYGNPNDSYELSSPKYWKDHLIIYGVDWENLEMKYFKLKKSRLKSIEEWNSSIDLSGNAASTIFTSFTAFSMIVDEMLIFTYRGGPITIIDLNTMTTLFQTVETNSYEFLSLKNNKVFFETSDGVDVIYRALDLNDFTTEEIVRVRNNNNGFFFTPKIPEFVENAEGGHDLIFITQSNDSTYFVNRLNTLTSEFVWETLCDQKNINNGPYHVTSDDEVVLVSSLGAISVYSRDDGDYLYSIERGPDNYSIVEPIIFDDRIISPAIDAIRCFEKSTGFLMWEFRSTVHPLSGEFGWSSTYEYDVLDDNYFVGKYPIDVFTGQSKWKFGEGQSHGDFSGLPAYDEEEKMLYYTGPNSFYKIRMPE